VLFARGGMPPHRVFAEKGSELEILKNQLPIAEEGCSLEGAPHEPGLLKFQLARQGRKVGYDLG